MYWLSHIWGRNPKHVVVKKFKHSYYCITCMNLWKEFIWLVLALTVSSRKASGLSVKNLSIAVIPDDVVSKLPNRSEKSKFNAVFSVIEGLSSLTSSIRTSSQCFHGVLLSSSSHWVFLSTSSWHSFAPAW